MLRQALPVPDLRDSNKLPIPRVASVCPCLLTCNLGAPDVDLCPVNVQQSFEDVSVRRFVDPNDPSQLFLASPVTQEQRLTEQPKYAADYGKAEAQYQDMSGDHS